jgi:hypothetical protein
VVFDDVPGKDKGKMGVDILGIPRIEGLVRLHAFRQKVGIPNPEGDHKSQNKQQIPK